MTTPDEQIQLDEKDETKTLPPSTETIKELEELFIASVQAIPPQESIHRTIKTVAEAGKKLNINPHDLKKFFLHNPRIIHLLEDDIGCVLDSYSLPQESDLPQQLDEGIILDTVNSMLSYFICSVKSGSMFNHVESYLAKFSEQDKDQVRALLSSEKFRAIIIETFMTYVGVLLDELYPHKRIVEARTQQRGKFKPLSNEEVHNPIKLPPPPFSILSDLRRNGLLINNPVVATTTSEIYAQCVLENLIEEGTLNEVFYQSDDRIPRRPSRYSRKYLDDNEDNVD